jgi:cobyric acid synthase
MLHGIFENDVLRAELIRNLARRKGIDAPLGPRVPTRESEYDRLAEAVRSNIDWKLIERIAGLN